MKKIYIYLLGATVVAGSVSCKKFLDQQPVSSASDETTWASDADANSSVAGCYSLIRSALNAAVSFYSYGDLPTDEFDNATDGDFQNIRQMIWNISVVADYTYDPKLKLRVYTPFYTAIAQSNRCLYFINNMSTSLFTGDDDAAKTARKNKYLGEAYFTRAFNYFYMARVWGDVPLVTDYQTDLSTNTAIARSAQSQVLALCVSDLNKAKQYLDWKDESSSDKVVRGDKGSVFALLAHVYAWKGDYDSCRMACDSVISSGSYSLVSGSSYKTIYSGQSSEGIFEIAQNTSSEAQNALSYSASIANYILTTPYLPTITVPGWQVSNSTLLNNLYTDTANDLRYKNTFLPIVSGSNTYYINNKYSNIQTISSSGTSYYLLLNNMIIFRLADIMLLKAEALVGQKSPDPSAALAIVNQVRSRAGLGGLSGLTGNDALNAVTSERGRELFLEGSRYYDLIRNERITGESQFPSMTQEEFVAGKYYWPLDPSLFLLNSKLTQTPYWKSKF